MKQHKCDHLLDYFNDQLNDKEKLEFKKHLEECSECQSELEEIEALTGDLPYLVEEEEMPEGMKERVLANVFAEDASEDRLAEKTESKSDQKIVPVKRPRRRALPFITGALAASFILSLAGNVFLIQENQETIGEYENLLASQEELEEQYIALIEQQEAEGIATTLLAAPLNSAGDPGQGMVSVIEENGELSIVIQVSDMPQLSGSEAFQAWVIEGETPYPAGSFVIDEEGNGALTYRISDIPNEGIDQIAITLEPQANNPAPLGEVVLASEATE